MTAAYTVNCSILLTEVPLLDRPAAARDAGFEAVEFWWPFESPTPPDAEVANFIRAIQDAGVQLTGLNFAAGDMPAGDRGILSDPGNTRAFRENVEVAVGIAETLGTRAFNALYGNRIATSSPDTQDYVGAENLAYAADAADRIGATVLIEPLGWPRDRGDSDGRIRRRGDLRIRRPSGGNSADVRCCRGADSTHRAAGRDRRRDTPDLFRPHVGFVNRVDEGLGEGLRRRQRRPRPAADYVVACGGPR